MLLEVKLAIVFMYVDTEKFQYCAYMLALVIYILLHF